MFKSIAMAGICVLASSTYAGTAETMFQAGPQHTGVRSVSPMGRMRQVRFAFRTEGAIRSTPALVAGVLYFGSGDGYLYSIDSFSGKELWRFKADGPVNSSPAVSNDMVYCTSRNGMLYALQETNGEPVWVFRFGNDVPYQYGFDYFTSSPTIENGVLYVGAGDGSLYAFAASSGKQLWKTDAGSRVRNSPAMSDSMVVFGTMDGRVIALNKSSGKKLWEYATFGTTLNFADFGFDRAAIVSSPSIADGIVTVGSRDGFLYALDLSAGHLLWKFDQKISWAISTPARADGHVYSGTSDGHFVQCLDEHTGKEQWRFPTVSGVWSSPVITGNEIAFGDFGGTLYGIDRENGKQIWRFKTGGPIYATPTAGDSVLFCGSDDGYLYALEGTGNRDTLATSLRKAVFWEDVPGFKWFQSGIEVWVRDYFRGEGYEVVDAKGLATLLQGQVAGTFRSVVIFAENRIPPEVADSLNNHALVRRYLDAGGKLVFLGPPPLAYLRDSTGRVTAIDFSIPGKVFDIHYPGNDLDQKGWYGSRVTAAGSHWGLRGWWVGLFTSVPRSEVTTVLAEDETGMAGAWVKNYGGPEGTGLVQLWVPRNIPVPLDQVQAAAEYGVR